MRHLLLFIIVNFIYLVSNPVFAQTLSPGIDPARLEERIPQQPSIPQPVARDQSIPLIEGLPEDIEEDDGQSGIEFAVANIEFFGNTVFDDRALGEDVSFAIGSAVTLGELKKAAHNITKRYRDAGYMLAKAYLPPQTLKNNRVEIHIAEGYVADVEFRGEALSLNSKAHDYADRLKLQNPVRRQDVERMVMLINDLSGLQAKAILAPVEGEPSAVKLILLPERDKYEGTLSLNNRGSNGLGPWQSSAQVTINDLTGFDESMSVLYLRTPDSNELSLWSFIQKWFLGDNGLQMQASFSRSESDPGGTASNLDFTGQSNSYSVVFTYPWLRSREENLYASLTFDSRNSSSEIFDVEFVDDNVRHLNAALAYNLFHHGGISDAKITFSKGLDIFSATEEGSLMASRPTGKSDAERIIFSANRFQNLSPKYRLIGRSKAQIAFDTVLSSDLFGVGGSRFGRAYDYSTITGESGYALSAEVVRTVDVPTKHLSGAKLSLFADWGQAYDRAVADGERWKGIGSVGFSASAKAFDAFDMKLDIANPVVQDGVSNVDRSTEAFFSLNYRF